MQEKVNIKGFVNSRNMSVTSLECMQKYIVVVDDAQVNIILTIILSFTLVR